MKRIVVLLLLLIINQPLQASDNSGAFLERGFGARPLALGGAFTGLAEGPDAIYYNGAGLARTRVLQLNSMYTTRYEVVKQTYVSGIIPADREGAFGLAYVNTGVDGIHETTYGSVIAGNTAVFRSQATGRDFSYGAQGLLLGYGRSIWPSLSVGVVSKYIREDMYGYHADGFGADIGVLYNPFDTISFGLNLQNIVKPVLDWQSSTGNNTDSIPFQAVLGASGTFDDLTLVADVTFRNNRQARFHAGIEYTYKDIIALRSGLNDGALTLGAGFRFGEIDFNYAYTDSPDGVLENNHAFSIGMVFDTPAPVTRAAEPVRVLSMETASATILKPSGRDYTFSDIQNHWSRRYVENIAWLGIINGRPEGLFDPNGTLTKAEAAKVILLAHTLKEKAKTALVEITVDEEKLNPGSLLKVDVVNEYGVQVRKIYDDVAAHSCTAEWDATDDHGKVVDDGFYTVRAAIVNPGVSTQQVALAEKQVNATSQYIRVAVTEKTQTDFVDVQPTHWASGIIQRITDIGLMDGESDLIFGLDKKVTKLEFVVAIARSLQQEGYKTKPGIEIPYHDAYRIPVQYQELVKLYVSVLGAGGDQQGMLNPEQTLTRAEAAIILERYLVTNSVLAYWFDLFHQTAPKSKPAGGSAGQETLSRCAQDAGVLELTIKKTETEKIAISGEARHIKKLLINGAGVYVRHDNDKFFSKLDYAINRRINLTAVGHDDAYTEISFLLGARESVIQGEAAPGAQVQVNGNIIPVKPDGQFYSRNSYDANDEFQMTVMNGTGKAATTSLEAQQEPSTGNIQRPIEMTLQRSGNGKIIIKGIGDHISKLSINGKTVPVRPSDHQFYAKLDYSAGIRIPVYITDKSNEQMEISILITADGKSVLRGRVYNGGGIKVNTSSLYLKENGWFYTKFPIGQEPVHIVITEPGTNPSVAGSE